VALKRGRLKTKNCGGSFLCSLPDTLKPIAIFADIDSQKECTERFSLGQIISRAGARI
jgi:hypothetical protein